jgi:hypothetical protein
MVFFRHFIVRQIWGKAPQFKGGSERIRTAVRGFADLCLATRPRNHFLKISCLREADS